MTVTVIQAHDLGWSVIPVKADKKPYQSWKEHQSIRPDRQMLQGWHDQFHPPMWAVVTGAISGVVVLDFDGEAGRQTLDKLGLDPHVQTPSGGFHVYAQYPDFCVKTLSGKTKQELGKSFPGLDIRGDGGYAVFGGRSQSGEYKWLREPTAYRFQDLPQLLQDYLKGPSGSPQVADDATARAYGTPVESLLSDALAELADGRNNSGFRLACALRDNGYNRQVAEQALKSFQSKTPSINARGEPEAYTVDEAMASVNEVYADCVNIVLNGDGCLSGSQGTEPRCRPWPGPIGEKALYGLTGDLVKLLGPHTEADNAALVTSFFAMFGNVIGRTSHFMAEADKHYMNQFVAQVGLTAKGRKGTSLGQIQRIFREIEETWTIERVQAGLSSGEGLIWAVRDPISRMEPIKEHKQVTGYQSVTLDEGVEDKRLMVVEGEFASTLRVLGREGNTLSPVIRNAWDTGNLRTLTKNSPAVATDAHISIIGHITKEELLRHLSRTEAGNGFGNRFLWVCVRRSKVLPDGGNLQDDDLRPFIERVRQAVKFARGVGQMTRDESAKALWYKVYPQLSEGRPGLLGAMVARAEAQVMRLACIYALLDLSDVVRREHLEAALALWKYCEESAEFIFGDSLGDPVADEILHALRDAPEGMTRTQISNHFGRNRQAAEMNRALSALLEGGLVRQEKGLSSLDGRPSERWFAAERTEAPVGLPEVTSSNSFISYPGAGNSTGEAETATHAPDSEDAVDGQACDLLEERS